MNVSPISQTQCINFSRNKYSFNTVAWSGYGAIGFGVASVIAANKKKYPLHKNFAYIAVLLAFLHIGIVEYNKYKYRKR